MIECSKSEKKKNMTTHDYVGKMIHRKKWKKLKVECKNEWYLLNVESDVDNETPKIRTEFEIQTDNLISARRPDGVIVNNKRTCWIVDFTVKYY